MDEDPRGKGSDWPMVLFGLGLAVFAAFQLFKLPPALPEMLRLYDYDLRMAAGFISVYALVGLVLSLPLGGLIARYGCATMVSAGLISMVLGNVTVLAWPETGWLVLLARALEGLGFAVCAIAGPVIANRHAGRQHLALVIGLTATWIPLGQIIAALMAAGFDAVKEAVGLPGIWQPLWVVAALSALLFVILCRRKARALDDTGLEKGAAAGRMALERTELHSLVLAAAVFLLWSAQYFAFMTWLPQYLVESRGLPERHALAGYLLPLLVLVTANVATGGLLRAGIAPGTTLLLGLALQAASWWYMPIHGSAGGPLGGIGLLLLYGLGAGITPTSLFAMPSTILGGGGAGGLAAGFAVLMTGRNIGIVIGPLLLAQIFAGSGYWEAGKPVFAVLATANVLLAVFLAYRLRRA